MNVLSLFDGMSCGQIALNRMGIKYDNYFASEIDKYGIQVTKKNFPNTKHIGSVVDVDSSNLPKIDLLFGGSPCQSFSFAGKMKGMSTKSNEKILSLNRYLHLKKKGFEFEGQSYLFWEFVRLLKETKTKHFLLENVMMSKEWEKVITKELGVKPIEINSALVSAQNRRRLFWTNIGMIQDGLFGDLICGIQQPEDKGILLKDILEDEVDDKYWLSEKTIAKILRYNNSDKMLDQNNKSSCLIAGYGKLGRDVQFIVNSNIRKLTPTECERLQTVPDGYTKGVSDTQRYKMLGNGWTVDVICHIFSYL